MNVLWVSEGKPEGGLTPEKENAYSEANTIFLWCDGWNTCRDSARYVQQL
jgi:hypothetical protein